MTYAEAIKFIESTEKFGIKPGLDAIKRLLAKLGNPQDDLNVIHIAGTNGKGSTASYIKSILMHAGYRVGFYTSPSLYALEERIQINNGLIDQIDFTAVTSEVKKAVDALVEEGFDPNTEFEIFTAMAFLHFKRHMVDFVVLEVGLGGRLDATNVVDKPLVSVITPIALDHVNILGDTLEKVAFEKGGIIKENVPLVIHPQEREASEVLKKLAEQRSASMIVAPVDLVEVVEMSLEGTVFTLGVHPYRISMIGKHQAQNAVVAMTAVELINREYDKHIPEEAIMKGLEATKWPCRLEVLDTSPKIILDGAHNPHGARALAKSLDDILPKGKMPTVILGMLGDKDVDEVLGIMKAYLGKVIVTEPHNDRKLSAEALDHKLKSLGVDTVVEKNPSKALKVALELTDSSELILAFGSFYLVGQIRQEVLSDDFR